MRDIRPYVALGLIVVAMGCATLQNAVPECEKVEAHPIPTPRGLYVAFSMEDLQKLLEITARRAKGECK